ncbi:probable cytosolic Fe-S cluster assembly factor v1g210509 isoform X2 [Bacillus rossius redtenbacheri]|uniref:probable cytosolic Fe-S cluster assembly factor v1g210509 isoform X2 n=1 Tax=Bacillus rossius redtenbacheri TaxID=93214 RepID=UPI002FDD47D0
MPPKRDTHYSQAFRDTYTRDFPCILKSSKGTQFAFFSVCRCDINIGHGGRYDINLHVNCSKHLANVKSVAVSSKECIKPVKIQKTESGTGAKITIQDDGAYVHLSKGRETRLQKVEISLSDCLACSGCITSAESVLVAQQSHEEVVRVFRENQQLRQSGRPEEAKLLVVSLSVQPVLSLAARYGLSPGECAERLSGYFKSLGADLVLDSTVADDLALLESQREFVERFQAAQEGPENAATQLPMLASSCPGWVCYAEKTHGSFILPYISTTKSPQQIMGSLVKGHLGRPPQQVYHVTLMPCYDKKLEASREEFVNHDLGTRDVDCVITAIELEQLLQAEGVELGGVGPASLDCPWGAAQGLWSHRGSGSGGYADHIFTHAAKELFGEEVPAVQFRTLRNPDFREAVLEKDGEVVLRFAIANGFRNIQNLVQKMKRGKTAYHYVEVMACPSGAAAGQHHRQRADSAAGAGVRLPAAASPGGQPGRGDPVRRVAGGRALRQEPLPAPHRLPSRPEAQHRAQHQVVVCI